ncbi:MAG: hypothetical protein LBG80_19020 [Bacteroidales bacterium]|jgi:hypothetical protein|nr:hypothetical protein [Bacteroidales bacterium]
METIVWEGIETMGENPASVEMDTGKIILNRDVFPKYSKFTRQFILEHERGHYKLSTDSEEEADTYALNKLYKSTNKSLKKSMKAITDFLDVDNPRVVSLYRKALIIDSKYNNNKKAKEELKNLTGDSNMRNKLSSMTSPFIRMNFGGISGRQRADGETIDEQETADNFSQVPEAKKYRRNSVEKYNILGFSMSIMEILFLIFIIVYLVKNK